MFARSQLECHELVTELIGLIDVFPIGVAVAVDPSCHEIRINRILRAMFGLPPDQHVVSSAARREQLDVAFRCIRNGVLVPSHELPIHVAAATGRIVLDDEFDVVRADGQRFHVLASAAPLRDRRGTICGAIGVVFDLTQRATAERALRFLTEASRQLATKTFDVEATLDRVAQLIVPELGDWAVVELFDEHDRSYVAGLAHTDRTKVRAMEALRGRRFLRPAAQSRAGDVLRRARPILVESVDDAARRRFIVDEAVAVAAALGQRSLAIAPLMRGRRLIGVISASFGERGRAYTDADGALLQELAHRASIAIVNARRYAREATVASAFQDAALPASLPDARNVRFDAVYLPGKAEAEVGGDWYDAFALPDGRIALSIGDVVGSGLDAATTMAKIRQTIRGAAFVDPDPLAMLHAGDLALKAERPDGIVTALAAILDPHHRILLTASAGHPGPALRRPDGSVFESVGTGLPLGLRDGETELSTVRPIALPAGTLVVFYTDGLIESTRDLAEGERRLRSALENERVVKSERPAQAIRDAVLFDGSRDDVAILTVLVTDENAPERARDPRG